MQAEIFRVAQDRDLKAGQAFGALYLAFLGKPSGPRAGALLAAQDRDFVIRTAPRSGRGRYAPRMISLQSIRDDAEGVKAAVARKGEPTDPIDRILAADARRRELEATTNELRAERNAGNKQLGEAMRGGGGAAADELKARMAELSAQIDANAAELSCRAAGDRGGPAAGPESAGCIGP